MADENKLFRKAALERLSSPEQLDALMQVTSPVGWLALVGAGLVIACVVVWSVFGSIPEKVQGRGILIHGGSVNDVVASTSGQIAELFVAQGAVVEKGQVLATVAQGSLGRKIKNLESLIAETTRLQKEERDRQERNTQLTISALKQERESVTASIENYREQIETVKAQIPEQEEAYKKGLIVKSTLLATRRDLAQIENTLAGQQVRLAQIESEVLASSRRLDDADGTRGREVDKLKRELSELKIQYEGSTKIVSPFAGHVLDVMAGPGDTVHPTTRLVIVERLDEPLEAVLYIPAGEGKKVRSGMEVRVSPSTVKTEEFGYILATVKSVEEFPSTPEGMRSVLRNDTLVSSLSGEGAPIEVVAQLIVDAETTSGFKWTSSSGPDSGVYSGTLCDSAIVIEKKRPIGLVIPILKKKLGM